MSGPVNGPDTVRTDGKLRENPGDVLDKKRLAAVAVISVPDQTLGER